MAAILAVIAGVAEMLAAKQPGSGSLGMHGPERAHAPDPETTSSLLKLMDAR